MDSKGNFFFLLGGGLVRADPEGKVTSVITAERVARDLAEIYAKKWPGKKTPAVRLGGGEGCSLQVAADGSIFGGGRTWPAGWKITPGGRFVPLCGYAPEMNKERWGPGDPSGYTPHCPMGRMTVSDGFICLQNEIPYALSRYEDNQVTVLKADGTFGLGNDFFFPPFEVVFRPNGLVEGCVSCVPGCQEIWIRCRKEK